MGTQLGLSPKLSGPFQNSLLGSDSSSPTGTDKPCHSRLKNFPKNAAFRSKPPMPSPWRRGPGLVSPLEFALGCSSRTGKAFGAREVPARESGKSCRGGQSLGLSRTNSPLPDGGKRSQARGGWGREGTAKWGQGEAEQELPEGFLGRRESVEPSREEQSSGRSQGKPHPVSSHPCANSPNPTFPAPARGSAEFQGNFKFSQVLQVFG